MQEYFILANVTLPPEGNTTALVVHAFYKRMKEIIYLIIKFTRKTFFYQDKTICVVIQALLFFRSINTLSCKLNFKTEDDFQTRF